MSDVSAFEFTDRARPIVQVGSGASGTAASTGPRWDVARWDVAGFAEWAGGEPTWTDASRHAMSCEPAVGRPSRARLSDEFEVGKADFLFDNASGWATPGGPVVAGEPRLVGGQQIRGGVVHTEFGIVWKFRGFIDDIEPYWAPDDWSTVLVRAIDPLGESGRARIAQIVARPEDETASERLGAVLDASPWSAAKRDIAVVATELVADTLDGKAINLLRKCALSAGGWVFGDVSGNVVFRGPSWLNDQASVHEAFVLTNDPAIDEPITVCPSGWTRPYRRSDITGRVILSNADSDPVIRESATAIDDYGAESIQIRDLWTKSPVDMAAIGDRILAVRSPETVPRVESVTIHVDGNHPDGGRAAVDLATLVDPNVPSRVRARFLDETGAVVFDDNCFVTAARHRISHEEWTVELALDRSEQFVVPGDPSEWDVASWNQAQWN